MRQKLNFKDPKVLKLLTTLVALYSALMCLKYLGHLTGHLFTSSNPLIPEYLSQYVAFPAFFIVPFFLALVLLSIRFLKTQHYNFKVVYSLFGIAVLFFIPI
jgi:hypothetical protein